MSQIAYHQYLTSLEQRGTTHEKIISILLSTPTPHRSYFPHHCIWNERWGVSHTTETETVACWCSILYSSIWKATYKYRSGLMLNLICSFYNDKIYHVIIPQPSYQYQYLILSILHLKRSITCVILWKLHLVGTNK